MATDGEDKTATGESAFQAGSEYVSLGSDKVDEPTAREQHSYTSEELRQGVELGSDETTKVDVARNSRHAVRGIEIANGIRVSGQHVAEVYIGTERDHATVSIVNSVDNGVIAVISSSGMKVPLPFGLIPGKMRALGREQEGQADLPPAVSRNHCAIGIDDDGKLVISNHEPANNTFIRKLG